MNAGWPGNYLGKATIYPGALDGAASPLPFYPLLFRVAGIRWTLAVGGPGILVPGE